MTRYVRNELVAMAIGAVTAGTVCGVWSAYVWHSSWLGYGLCGAIVGGLTGLRQTIVEAIVMALILLVVLCALHRFCGYTLVRVGFALIASIAMGTLGASTIGSFMDDKIDHGSPRRDEKSEV